MSGITFAQAIAWFIGGVIALVTGGVGTAIVQGWMNRDTAKAEAARQVAEKEKAREDARRTEADRLALVQEIERKAYDRAVEASDKAYGQLEKRCESCLQRVDHLQGALQALLHANEVTLPMLERMIRENPDILPAAEHEMVVDLRTTLQAAHRTLWD